MSHLPSQPASCTPLSLHRYCALPTLWGRADGETQVHLKVKEVPGCPPGIVDGGRGWCWWNRDDCRLGLGQRTESTSRVRTVTTTVVPASRSLAHSSTPLADTHMRLVCYLQHMKLCEDTYKFINRCPRSSLTACGWRTLCVFEIVH